MKKKGPKTDKSLKLIKNFFQYEIVRKDMNPLPYGTSYQFLTENNYISKFRYKDGGYEYKVLKRPENHEKLLAEFRLFFVKKTTGSFFEQNNIALRYSL